MTMHDNLSLESFTPEDRPLVDDGAIRKHCRPLYSHTGKPSIPPEQQFLALLSGYLSGITSERRLVMELQCTMALRWFVGLNLDQDAWDHSTFKSFVPIELAMDPEEYKWKLRSTTDPDCRMVSKGSSGTGAYPGYTVNAVMEN